jgi:cytochrome c oxidase subunit 2
LRRHLRAAAGLIAGSTLLAACAVSDKLPQSSLNPAGQPAGEQKDLLLLIVAIAAVIFVAVEAALIFFLFRYRHREGNEPLQIHGHSKTEIAWTIAPAIILAIIAVPTVSMIYSQAAVPKGKSITVYAVGHQWWWEFVYPDQKVVTANEMYIPTDTQVHVELCSAGNTAVGTPIGAPCTDPPPAIGDAVIHSFWVPRLAGKQDVVPGRTNSLTLTADEPGEYPGQCAEFCGMSHGFMKFKVIAATPADFQTWISNEQSESIAPAASSTEEAGLEAFKNTGCVGCHTADPVAAGIGGPNLTHFASRDCFAGCMLDTNEENLQRWLRDPAAVKPGSFMPNLHLTEEQVKSITAYLLSLE